MIWEPKSVVVERLREEIRARIVNTIIQIPERIQELLICKLRVGERYIIPRKVWTRLVTEDLDGKSYPPTLFEGFCQPFRVLFVSSVGILDEPNQTIAVPSAGVWRLACYLTSDLDFVDVMVCDPNLGGLRILDDLLENNEFDLVGVSLIPANIRNDLELMEKIRKDQPKSVLIAGGVNSFSFLQWKHFADLPIDALIIGPGEMALGELILKLRKEPGYSKNFFRGKRPVIIEPKLMDTVFAFDEHIMPFGDGDCVHPVGYSSRILYYKFSNFCPESCFWCVSPKDDLRESNPIVAVADLEKRLQIDQHADISFIDNNLTAHPKFIKRACEIMSRRRIKTIRKHGKLTINGVDEDLLGALQKAGFVRLAFGIESFSEEVREGLGRFFDNNLIERVLSSVLKKNMRPEINLILFSPFENIQSLAHTLQASSDWVEENDCFIMIVLGLHGVIGTQNVPSGLKINQIKIPLEGGKRIEIPGLFTMSQQVESVYKIVSRLYRERLLSLCETAQESVPNHIKSLLKCQATADVLGLSCSSKFAHGIERQKGINYVSV